MPSCQITEFSIIDASSNASGHFQLSCSFLGLYCLGYSPIGTLNTRTYETLFDLFVSQRGIIDPNSCVRRHWTHQLPHHQHQFHSPKYNRHTHTYTHHYYNYPLLLLLCMLWTLEHVQEKWITIHNWKSLGFVEMYCLFRRFDGCWPIPILLDFSCK